jgi:MoxR-like ATPase
MVLNSCYQIFLDKKILNRVIPRDFQLIAAGNLADDGANTFDIPAPLKDRMSHFKLAIPTVQEWVTNFAIPNNVDSRVITYLMASENNFHTYSPDDEEILFSTQ